jgi:FtsH-binding integral membrane protein
MNQYQETYGAVEHVAGTTRAEFIKKTYLHLAGSILAFVLIEAYLFSSGLALVIAEALMGISWLLVLGLFMGVSMLANWWAHSAKSSSLQYLGLGLFIVAEAIIFTPLLVMAAYFSGGGMETIAKAGIVTLGLFGGLTATVFVTKTDFSFLRPVITIGGFIALGFIASSLIFGFDIGSLFAFVMVAFAATSILYNTSGIMREYHPSQHIAASLSLFASVALLFWYILTIFNRSND